MDYVLVYDENGNYLRWVPATDELAPGEFASDHQLSEDELIAIFPNYVPMVWRAVQQLARSALIFSDGVAVRCFKAAAPFPQEWVAYVEALRAIVRTHSGDPAMALPTPPDYPADT